MYNYLFIVWCNYTWMYQLFQQMIHSSFKKTVYINEDIPIQSNIVSPLS